MLTGSTYTVTVGSGGNGRGGGNSGYDGTDSSFSGPGIASAPVAGGGSVLGTPQRQSNVGVAGYNGADYGVGGSGAGINQSSTTVAGGDGSDGVVIVTEHYMGVAG